MQKKLRKIMVILLSLVFVVSGASIGNAALGTNITLTHNVITENANIGTIVGYLGIANPGSGVIYTYSLPSTVSDKDNKSFIIDGNVLKTKSAIDYETKAQYSIRIRARGSDGSTYVEKFDIVVNDINEAPIAKNATYTTKTGAAITGTLKAEDPENNTLWYSIKDAVLLHDSVYKTVYGSVSITNVNTGAFNYTPTTTYTGALTDSFKFSVFDGVYLSNATATIKINKEAAVTSGISLSIRPGTINLNSANGKTPILAVIKLGSNYDFEDVDLETLEIMVGETELTNIKKPARIYGNSEDGYFVKAMFKRSDIPNTIEPDENGKIIFTASLALKNATTNSTLLQGTADVKVKLAKSLKDIKINDDKKDKNDNKLKHNDDDDEEEDDD